MAALWKLADDVSGDSRDPALLTIASHREIRDAPCTIVKVCDEPEHFEP